MPSLWERWASLLGRIVIIFAMVYVPYVFWTSTWRHYEIPKVASFQILMLMLGACWAVIVTRFRMVRSAAATAACFFLFWIAFSALVSVNMAEAWEEILFMTACMAMVVLMPKFFTHYKDFAVLVYLMGFLCALVCLYALAMRWQWEWFFRSFDFMHLRNMGTLRPVSTMGNENYTSEFLNITTPILFCMMIHYRKSIVEFMFYSAVTSLCVITLFYIDQNAAFVGFALAIPIVFGFFLFFKIIPFLSRLSFVPFNQHKMNSIFVKSTLALLIIISLGATLLASIENPIRQRMLTMSSWVDIDEDNFPDGVPPIVFRLQCMDAAIRKIVETPVLGIGAGNFKVIHPLYESQLERKVLGKETLARKVHNDHLEHAVEYGFFGLLGWYWLLAIAVFCIFRTFQYVTSSAGLAKHPLNSSENDFYFYIQMGCLGGILVSLGSCMFGHTFVLPGSTVTIWLAVGVSVAVYQRVRRAMAGLSQPLFGISKEPPSQLQNIGKVVPAPVRWLVFFMLVLPLGGMSMYQFMGETWLRAGMTHMDNGRFNSMFRSMNLAFKYYPYQMETFYILGRYYIDAAVAVRRAEDMPDKGAQMFIDSQMPERYRYDEPRLLREGILCLQIDVFMNPNYKWAHNNLGVLYDRLGEQPEIPESARSVDLSRASYQRVFQIDQEQIFARFNTGLGYYKQGQFDKAIEELEKALVVDPNYVDVYQYLAFSFAQQGDHVRTISAADKFVSANLVKLVRPYLGGEQRAQYQMVIDALTRGELTEALQTYKRLASYTNESLHSLYATAALGLGQSAENLELAYQALRKSEMLVPEMTIERLIAYADFYFDLNRWAESTARYQEVIRRQPQSEFADRSRRRIAHMYISNGMYGQGRNVLAQVVQNNPQSWPDKIIYAQLMTGDPAYTSNADAIPLLQQAVALGGEAALQEIANSNYILFQPLWEDPQFLALMGAFHQQGVQAAQAAQAAQAEAPQE